MKINKIGYLIKEGIRGIFLHGFMSFAAICVTVACLLIVGGFACVTYNISNIIEEVNKTNEVLAFVDESYTRAEGLSIGTRLNQMDNIADAKFVSKEVALEQFVAEHEGDNALTGVDANPLRHRYKILLKDNRLMQQTVAELMEVEGIVKVSAAYELAEGFTTLQDILRIASLAIIGVLLLVSLLIISNTVKLAMYDRRDEIAIMKMVGATNGFIRLPYVIEGFTLGMVGAGLSFGLLWMLYKLAKERLDKIDTLDILHLVPFQQLLIPMIIVFSAAGLFVGVVGSWTSIRKFMDV